MFCFAGNASAQQRTINTKIYLILKSQKQDECLRLVMLLSCLKALLNIRFFCFHNVHIASTNSGKQILLKISPWEIMWLNKNNMAYKMKQFRSLNFSSGNLHLRRKGIPNISSVKLVHDTISCHDCQRTKT